METIHSTRKPRHILVDCFLVCYNGMQIMGWSCLFIHMLLFSAEQPMVLWHNLQNTLIATTSFLVLELAFSLLGIVRSSACSVFFLILCRLLILWGVLMSSLPALHNTGLNLLILAWSTHEIIRYLFYCLDVMDCVPYMMIWLRYSAFILLYPLGTVGELLCFYASVQYFQRNPRWYLDLPEPWDTVVSYRTFLLAVMMLYVPVFPAMYFHLLSKRKRILRRLTISQEQIKSEQGLI